MNTRLERLGRWLHGRTGAQSRRRRRTSLTHSAIAGAVAGASEQLEGRILLANTPLPGASDNGRFRFAYDPSTDNLLVQFPSEFDGDRSDDRRVEVRLPLITPTPSPDRPGETVQRRDTLIAFNEFRLAGSGGDGGESGGSAFVDNFLNLEQHFDMGVAIVADRDIDFDGTSIGVSARSVADDFQGVMLDPNGLVTVTFKSVRLNGEAFQVTDTLPVSKLRALGDPMAFLAASKTDIVEGETIDFTIHILNADPDEATEVRVFFGDGASADFTVPAGRNFLRARHIYEDPGDFEAFALASIDEVFIDANCVPIKVRPRFAINGTDGPDVILARNGANNAVIFNVNQGEDIVVPPEAGTVVISPGDGDDSIDLSQVDDRIVQEFFVLLERGVNAFLGSPKDDTIISPLGDDNIQAGGGNDKIILGTGAKTIDGGDGDDTIHVTDLTFEEGANAPRSQINGGAGLDAINLTLKDSTANTAFSITQSTNPQADAHIQASRGSALPFRVDIEAGAVEVVNLLSKGRVNVFSDFQSANLGDLAEGDLQEFNLETTDLGDNVNLERSTLKFTGDVGGGPNDVRLGNREDHLLLTAGGAASSSGTNTTFVRTGGTVNLSGNGPNTTYYAGTQFPGGLNVNELGLRPGDVLNMNSMARFAQVDADGNVIGFVDAGLGSDVGVTFNPNLGFPQEIAPGVAFSGDGDHIEGVVGAEFGPNTLYALDPDNAQFGDTTDQTLTGGRRDDLLVGSDDTNVLDGGPAGSDLLRGRHADDRDRLNGRDRSEVINGSDNVFDISGFGNTIDYSLTPLALVLDLDLLNVRQASDAADNGAQFNGAPPAHFIASAFDDDIQVDPLAEPRRIDGLAGNDTVTIDAQGREVLRREEVDGVTSIVISGFAVIAVENVETINIVNEGVPAALTQDLSPGDDVARLQLEVLVPRTLATLTLHSGGESTTFVQRAEQVVVSGNGGTDSLIVDARGESVRLTGNEIRIGGLPPILANGFARVEVVNASLTLALSDETDQATLVDNADGTFTLRDDLLTFGGGYTFQPGTNSVRVLGLDGNDVVDMTAATFPVHLVGNAGNDDLRGGRANDRLNGGTGHDRLTGFLGADQQHGASGRDQFVWNNGDGPDDNFGGGGLDVFEFNGADGAGDIIQLAMADAGGEAGGATHPSADFVLIRLDPSAFTIENSSVERTVVNGLGGSDEIDASGLDAAATRLTINGGTENDVLTGGPGDDEINGGAGRDVLTGNGGADHKNGGSGPDTAIWRNGDGADDIRGSRGRDKFIYNGDPAAGDAVVLTGADVDGGAGDGTLVNADLQLTRTAPTALTIELADIENALVRGRAGDDVISTRDLPANALERIVLEGGAGDDELDGGAAAEVLRGGSGNDLLRDGLGDDQVDGGPGHDVFDIIGGTDVLLDAAGIDRISFAQAEHAVDIILDLFAIQDVSPGHRITLNTGFEQFMGSGFDDRVQATALDRERRLDGGAGNDQLLVDSAGRSAEIVGDSVEVEGLADIVFSEFEQIDL